jgi:hypothetical protein
MSGQGLEIRGFLFAVKGVKAAQSGSAAAAKGRVFSRQSVGW